MLGGAVVYSHYINSSVYFNDDTDCLMIFKARREDWKLMLRMIELNIPDRTPNGICNDALYVADSDNIYTNNMVSTHF